ncbi:MAG: hypothetical protein ACLTFB_00980 [Candidatus Phytoplasma pyri]
MSKNLEIFELINSLFAGIMIGIFIMFCINFFTLKKDVSFNPEDLKIKIDRLEKNDEWINKDLAEFKQATNHQLEQLNDKIDKLNEFKREINVKFRELNDKIDKLLVPKTE